MQDQRQPTRIQASVSPQQCSVPRPYLVPHPQPQVSRSLLALWHLLSLDAPTVAALWTYFLARCSGIQLPWTAPTAMFVAVWMIYAADRLLDSHDLEARHHFHHRYRTQFLSFISIASLVLTYLLHRIDLRALHLYALLATLLAVWLLLIHARPSSNRRLPKEVAVGLFFPAAAFIPTVARAPQLRSALIPAAVLFAAVCTLNCLFLYAWEHPDDLSKAHSTTRVATRHLWHLAVLVCIICTLTVLLARAPYLQRPAIACALSSVSLILLHINRNRVTPIHLRAMADIVLLSPLLVLTIPVR